MDREHEFQRLAQADQDIADGAEHVKWQREVVDILERISACAEATEGARAVLTILLKTQAQREQQGGQTRANLDVISPSTVPLAQVLDHQTDLELAVQREQDGDPICASLNGNVASPSTVPLGQPEPIEHRTDLAAPVQRERDGDPLHASLHGDIASPSTVPPAQPIDHQNKATTLGDIAGRSAKRTLVQIGAKTGLFWWFVKTAAARLSNLGRARSKLRN